MVCNFHTQVRLIAIKIPSKFLRGYAIVRDTRTKRFLQMMWVISTKAVCLETGSV